MELHLFSGPNVKTGFVHGPLLPKMVLDENLTLPLEETTKILRQIIETLSDLLTEEEDA